MATTQINSAVPRQYQEGIKDSSRRSIPLQRLAIPTHLPKIWSFMETGELDATLAVGATRTRLFGANSFDERSKFATHATVLGNIVDAQANMGMYQRVLGDNPGPKASLRIYMDVLIGQLPAYERMPDGTYKLDDDHQKIPVKDPVTGLPVTISGGVAARFIAKQIVGEEFGLGSLLPGVQDDGVNQSIQYPIEDLEVPHFGSYGNNAGIRNYPGLAIGANPIDTRLLTSTKVYPYFRSCVRRADEFSTGKQVNAADGDQAILFSLKPATFDKNTDKALYLGDTFIQRYQDLQPAVGIPKLFGPFGRQHLYQENIDELLELIYNAEAPWANEFSDITGTDVEDEKYLINLFGAHSSTNVPYTAFQLDFTGEDVVRMSSKSVFYARGASDGVMNEDVLAKRVSEEVKEYNNPDSHLMDMAVNVESIIYDSGFPLQTKYDICNAIAIRKDIAVALATHDVLGRTLTASEESSLAISLRTRLQLYPESEVHGTPVCRGVIIGRSGLIPTRRYTKRLPLTLEIAHKAARYMGAADGRWKNGFLFDNARREPGSIVELFRDINVTFTSDRVRNTDWANGLIWVQNLDRDRQWFPALQTVYDDDTSVLNSFFTMMACVELEKVGFRSWQRYSGSMSLSNSELKKGVEDDITADVKDRFDNNFIIIPEVTFTQADLDRGYSWTTTIHIGAHGMKTANSLTIESHRFDDLAAGLPQAIAN